MLLPGGGGGTEGPRLVPSSENRNWAGDSMRGGSYPHSDCGGGSGGPFLF